MPDRDRIPDDFWNVEDLLPQKSPRRTPTPPRPTPEAVEIELPSRGTTASSAEAEPVRAAALTVERPATPAPAPGPAPTPTPSPTPTPTPSPAPTPASEGTHYLPRRSPEEPAVPLVEYRPEGALLHRVRIFGWTANYHYFDQFADDAARYDAMKPPAEARPEPFFSYFPQYVQLTRRSTAWYLYWRECVRRGTYPDTDYAYVLLYLFELINLPADEDPTARRCRDLMANVWMAYRRTYPQLDHYMCEWLCDYCLIHGLPAPIDLLAPALDDIIPGSRLKEFYLSAAVRVPAEGAPDTALETARILMRHCCQYDYRKSKFASGEHKAMFDRIIPTAVASAIPLLLGSGGTKPVITMLDSTLTRDAYTGALCSYRNKRRIEVSYTSFSRSHELRFLIGDMVKHVENRLRGWIGVRSRLSVMSLPTPLRDALDACLAPLEPSKSASPVKKKESPRPAYEALYDLPAKTVTVADAAAIEAESWETTRILVDAFGEGEREGSEVLLAEREAHQEGLVREDAPKERPSEREAAPAEPIRNEGSAESEGSTAEGWVAALTPYRDFLRSALHADSAAQKQAAEALCKMPDAIADEINTLTADPDLENNPICDIILEDDGTGTYTLIEDYRPDIEALL